MTKWIRMAAVFAAVLVAARVASAQEDLERFVRDLREQARQNPQRMDLQISLGNAAVQAQKYDIAIEAFQTVLDSLDPDSSAAGDLLLRLGETERRKGDTDAAVTALTHARVLLPDNPLVTGTLALVFDGAGRYAEAQDAYRTTLKLDPENATAMNNLAYLLAMHGGGLDQALALARGAHARSPEAPEVSDTLAVVLMKSGDNASALPLLMDAVGREPLEPLYRTHLAASLGQKADRSAREQELLDALGGEPSEQNGQRITELLRK